jgi:hypothetical protein
MQHYSFCCIYDLAFRNGEPILDPLPRIVWSMKFCASNGPKHKLRLNDFALKAQVVELFEYMESVGEGVISILDVQNGLPFRMQVEEVMA